jgi:hypothetical protein
LNVIMCRSSGARRLVGYDAENTQQALNPS